jgi:Na+-driven multidrug efflux pump
MIWGVVVFLLLLVLGQAVASLFTDDLVVVEITKKYFYIIGASYGFQGLVMLSTSSYNGINKPYPSAVFSVVRMLVFYVPLAWLGAKIFQINGVFWAGFIANVVIGVLSFWYLHKTIKRMETFE